MSNKETDKIQQRVFVKYNFDDFLSLFGAINSVFERTLLNQSFCNIVYLKFFIQSILGKLKIK